MHVSAPRSVLLRELRRLGQFAGRSVADPPEWADLLLEADPAAGTLRLTAEGPSGAAQLCLNGGDQVAVRRSGTAQVPAKLLLASVGATAARTSVELELTTVDGVDVLEVRDGRRTTRVRAADPSAPRPSVAAAGAAAPELTVAVPDLFAVLRAGGAAYDRHRMVPLLAAVHLGVAQLPDGSGGTRPGLRATSLDRLCAAASTRALPAPPATPSWEVLLRPDAVRRALPVLERGERAHLRADPARKRVTVAVEEGAGRTTAVVELATLHGQDPASFPSGTLRPFLLGKFTLGPWLAVDRAAAQSLLRVATTRERHAQDAAYRQAGRGAAGSAQKVGTRLTLSPRALRVQVDGDPTAEVLEAQGWTGGPRRVRVSLPVCEAVLRAYPEQEEELRVAVLEQGGRPGALLLFTESGGWLPAHGGLPEDYLGVLPLS